MNVFYNEIEPFAAAWLRRLIEFGELPKGVVDERDIRDIEPGELLRYDQCHFFAGIGGWALALRYAGWTGPVWTGSCPCQPFSQAGRKAGHSDDRHLWPFWFHLLEICRPAVIFGEQVSSKDGLTWFDTVQADLEGEGYAFGAFDACAAGVGAPHIRQRGWFVAERLDHSPGTRFQDDGSPRPGEGGEPRRAGASVGMADSGSIGRERRERSDKGVVHDGQTAERAESVDEPHHGSQDGAVGMADPQRDRLDGGRDAGQGRGTEPADGGGVGGMADSCCTTGQQVPGSTFKNEETHGGKGWNVGSPKSHKGRSGDGEDGGMADSDQHVPERTEGARTKPGEACSRPTFGEPERCSAVPGTRRAGPVNGYWRDADWLFCRDDSWRPVEPGTFPLVDGLPNRVGLLRGYGNAIVPQEAALMIESYMDLVENP